MTLLKYSSSVFGCTITSAVLFFQIELAKCKAKNLSGLPVYLASLLGSIVEELVTTIVFSGRRGAIFKYKSFFASKSSAIDSITKSASSKAFFISSSNLILSLNPITLLISSSLLKLSASAIPLHQLLKDFPSGIAIKFIASI